VRVHVFTMVLRYSRRIFARGYCEEGLVSLLEGHAQAFEHFGCRAETILYDNPRTMVLSKDESSGWVEWNTKFKDRMDLYVASIRLCRYYWAKTKGKVGRGVKYVKRNARLGGAQRLAVGMVPRGGGSAGPWDDSRAAGAPVHAVGDGVTDYSGCAAADTSGVAGEPDRAAGCSGGRGGQPLPGTAELGGTQPCGSTCWPRRSSSDATARTRCVTAWTGCCTTRRSSTSRGRATVEAQGGAADAQRAVPEPPPT
jgi:hypothetical protein